MSKGGLVPTLHVLGRQKFPASYEVHGENYAVFTKRLAPGEFIFVETGALTYMSASIVMEVEFAGMAALSGENIARSKFTNKGAEVGYIGLSPNLPMSSVIPLQMSEYGSEGLYVKRGAWMASEAGVSVLPGFLPARDMASFFLSGMAPIIQKLTGTGLALIAAGGTLVQMPLAPGQVILVDSHSLVAFTPSVGYQVRRAGSCATMLFGGEGAFNTELTGPGMVWVQTISYDGLAKLFVVKQSAGQQRARSAP